jgi:DNA-binding HxlR family transcriptional regulator
MRRDLPVTELTRYRWCVPVMAELLRSEGSKFVTLVRRLGASDKAIRQALDYLIDCGWVVRNPGYGHPWRPEYILTSEGARIAEQCSAILSSLGPASNVALERWALPLLLCLADGPLRHAALRRAATPITPRALTLSLAELIDAGLVTRTVKSTTPPSVEYALTDAGHRIAAQMRHPASKA